MGVGGGGGVDVGVDVRVDVDVDVVVVVVGDDVGFGVGVSGAADVEGYWALRDGVEGSVCRPRADRCLARVSISIRAK